MSMHARNISGVVSRGKNRGKDLGYPTANIGLGNGIESEGEIEEGIYVSETRVIGEGPRKNSGDFNGSQRSSRALWMPSVTFVGAAKTFEEVDVNAETYILDWEGDLYGKRIEVKLKMKIRNNEKFKSVDDLIRQIEKDINETREYFNTHSS